MTMKTSSAIAAAVEAFVGIRVELPTGKKFVANKPLLFLDAIRWMELLEQHAKGGAYTETMGIIIKDLRENHDVVDLSVLQDLTFGEFHDYVLMSFFSHRRSLPGWMVQLLEQQREMGKEPPAATPN
jgi:hypothetical protein